MQTPTPANPARRLNYELKSHSRKNITVLFGLFNLVAVSPSYAFECGEPGTCVVWYSPVQSYTQSGQGAHRENFGNYSTDCSSATYDNTLVSWQMTTFKTGDTKHFVAPHKYWWDPTSKEWKHIGYPLGGWYTKVLPEGVIVGDGWVPISEVLPNGCPTLPHDSANKDSGKPCPMVSVDDKK